MKVWLAHHNHQYEGWQVTGVFSTEESARAASTCDPPAEIFVDWHYLDNIELDDPGLTDGLLVGDLEECRIRGRQHACIDRLVTAHVALREQVQAMRELFGQVEIALSNMRVDQHKVAMSLVRKVTLSKRPALLCGACQRGDFEECSGWCQARKD